MCNAGASRPAGGQCAANAITVSQFLVSLTVSLPLLLSVFDDGKQENFRSGIAKVFTVSTADATIDKIESLDNAPEGGEYESW